MPWYVVVTRPRAELKVKDRLKAIGVEVCCPTRVEKRQWSDRVKKVEVPLLPSMVLVFLEVKDRELIFSVPGVVRYLFYLGKPAVVPKKEVDALNEIEKKGVHVVGVKTVVNRRHTHDEIGTLARGLIADPSDDAVVHIDGEVRTVLLDRADGEKHDTTSLSRATRFRPGHVFEKRFRFGWVHCELRVMSAPLLLADW